VATVSLPIFFEKRMNKIKVVVVGNGMVGHHYVETLANSDVSAHITVIGGESRPAYDRVHLSEVFDGKEPSDLAMTTREHYVELGVDAHFGDFVKTIDRDSKKVHHSAQQQEPRDLQDGPRE
jgi:nitrite reductase (NADH) large subunit